ncbi:MAG: hypothetical protein J5903_02515, partial [Clostridia bacterium]|nr:hypothetical protein [Clostridia bacterium]
MKKKYRILLWLAITLCTMTLFAACSPNKLQTLKNSGYVISVYYDANGGAFFNNEEETALIDMFDPSEYTKDADGKTRIKLTDPTSPVRAGSGTAVFVTNYEHTLLGWYQKRTAVT